MTQGVTEMFDEYDNNVNDMLWPLQPPDRNLIEHLWKILDRHVRQHSLPPSSKHQMRECLFKERFSNPPAEFQRLTETMPRCTEPVLVVCSGPTLRRHFMLVFPTLSQLS